jgi:hypothetical protein
METIELWPFSQGEIDETADGFIDAIFTRGEELRHTSAVLRAEYAERIVRGGFPEAVARSNARRRERFLDSYVADLVARDVAQLSDIERTAQMRALVRLRFGLDPHFRHFRASVRSQPTSSPPECPGRVRRLKAWPVGPLAPLTPMIKGVSRSLAEGRSRRSGGISDEMVQISKLTTREGPFALAASQHRFAEYRQIKVILLRHRLEWPCPTWRPRLSRGRRQ